MKRIALALCLLILAGALPSYATIDVTTARIVYSGSGSTGPFSVPFYFTADTDLEVIKVDAATLSVESTLILNVDYAVTGAGSTSGYITLSTSAASALTSSYKLVILRTSDFLQATDYSEGGKFSSATAEAALDKQSMQMQELKDATDRAIQMPRGGSYSGIYLPKPQASKLIGWDSLAAGLQLYSTTEVQVPEIDVISNHDDSLTTMVSDLGSTKSLVMVNKLITQSADVSIAGSTTLWIPQGGMISIDSGKTITFDSPENIMAPNHQIFTGSGTVTFTKPGVVHPEWWGAVGDNATDSHDAIEAACASLPDQNPIYYNTTGGVVKVGSGAFVITEKVTCRKNGIVFEGEGLGETRFRCTSALAADPCLEFDRQLYDDADYTGRGQVGTYSYTEAMLNQVRVRKFHLDVYSSTGGGIRFGPGEKQILEDVWLYNATSGYNGYGVKFDGDHFPMWSSIESVHRVRISGFEEGIWVNRAGMSGVWDSIIEYCDYGLHAPYDISSVPSIGVVSGCYFQSCGIGINNGGYHAVVIGNTFEENTVYDYSDADTTQSHNALISNSWTLDDVTFLPTKLNYSASHIVIDRWLPNQLAGMRNSGLLDLKLDGAGAHGPSVNMHMTGIDSGGNATDSILGLNTWWGTDGNGTDAFGQTVDASTYRATISSRGQRLDIGTTTSGSYPVNVLVGAVKKAAFGNDSHSFFMNYGADEWELAFQVYGASEADLWGLKGLDPDTGVQDYISPWGPVHTITSLTDGLRIGPLGYYVGPHALWYTAFMGYRSDTNVWDDILTINGFGVHVRSPRVPATATDDCYAGQIAFSGDASSGHIYYCVADNTWLEGNLVTMGSDGGDWTVDSVSIGGGNSTISSSGAISATSINGGAGNFSTVTVSTTISAGAGGFSVDADGDVTASSFTTLGNVSSRVKISAISGGNHTLTDSERRGGYLEVSDNGTMLWPQVANGDYACIKVAGSGVGVKIRPSYTGETILLMDNTELGANVAIRNDGTPGAEICMIGSAASGKLRATQPYGTWPSE